MASEKRPTSLMQITTTARRFGIGCVVFIVGVFAYQQIKGFVMPPTTTPTGTKSEAYMPATNGFGDIQPLQMSSLELAPGSSPEFAIDNRFGEFPTTANVYKVLQPREKFGSVERAEAAAQRLDFTTPFAKISEQELQWKSETRTLSFNKVFRKWNYNTDLTKDEKALETHRIDTDKSEYLDGSLSALGTLGIKVNNFSTTESIARFMRMDKSVLIETTNPTSAQFVHVSLYQIREAMTPKDSIIVAGQKADNDAPVIQGKVYRDNPMTGSASLVLSDTGSDMRNLYAFEMTEWEIDPNREVYAIVSVDEAWQRIQEGKGFLKYLNKEGKSELAAYEPLQVKRFTTSNESVSIGYFESDSYNSARPYQTPMFVFGGRAELVDGTEADFLFFVDALK